MGKFLLVMVAGVSLAAGALMMTSTRDALIRTGERLTGQGEATTARSVAHSGMAVAESALAAELAATGTYSGPDTYRAPFGGGRYTTTVTASGDAYTILSVGVSGADTSRVQRVYRFERGGASAPPPVPAFMGAAISTKNNLQIKNDFIVASADGSTNADVHVNNDFQISGGTVRFDGFATYGNNLQIKNGQTEAETFTPVSNPDGLPLTEGVDKITFPKFDASEHAHLATRTSSGDQTLFGAIALGTADAPEIWYIDGNVKTGGDLTVSGYGAIITTGNVTIKHNVRMLSGGGPGAFALYTGNNLKVDAASLTLEGQLLTGGNFQVKANTTVVGSITVGNDFQTEGAFTTVYRPATNLLTDPFWPPAPVDDGDADAGTGGSEGGERLVTVSTRVW